MTDDGRIRRALLFMPGDDMKKIGKGAALGVDAVIMDLEDSVGLNAKQAARETVRRALGGAVDFGRTERLVRVNPTGSGMQQDDIAATLPGRPDGYIAPKVELALEVRWLSEMLLEQEHRLGIEPGATRLLAIVETARGVVNLREIAGADVRLVALMFGAEDLAGSMGAIRTPDSPETQYARSAVVIHAAASGLQAIDTPYVDLHDEDGLRAEAGQALRMGYTGKMAIHPAQVGPILDVFTPSDEEIAQAQRLVEAHTAQQAAGAGVFAFEGRMVDMPMVRAAQRVLARAHATGKL